MSDDDKIEEAGLNEITYRYLKRDMESLLKGIDPEKIAEAERSLHRDVTELTPKLRKRNARCYATTQNADDLDEMTLARAKRDLELSSND